MKTVRIAVLLLVGAFVLAILLSLAHPATAASCRWRGEVNGAWDNPANWTNCGGRTPGSSDTVTILGGTRAPIVAADKEIAGLTLEKEAVLMLQEGVTLTVTGMVQHNGTLAGSGDLVVLGVYTFAKGTVTGRGVPDNILAP